MFEKFVFYVIIGSFRNWYKGVGRPAQRATNHRSNATVEVVGRNFFLLIMMHWRRRLEYNYLIMNRLDVASGNLEGLAHIMLLRPAPSKVALQILRKMHRRSN
jgi:predicted nucleic acid-binding OB-fold protein